jgi:ribosomal-protein-alanine N-acetyltransferase
MFWNWGRPTRRAARPDDRDALLALTRREQRVHVHLDWRPVEAWLGESPFELAERGQRLLGALACPPGPPDTAWIRLLAFADHADVKALWKLLWPPALEQLRAMRVSVIAALSLDDWIDPLLLSASFERTHSVVVLTRRGNLPVERRESAAIIRRAQLADQSAIIAADLAAFASPWQLTADMLELAIGAADYLTVAEVEGRIVGYQLTTANTDGGHLGRLAVLPEWQGRGLGAALVADLAVHYRERGAQRLTVNTQDTNAASLSVYRRLGFELSGEAFPVYQLRL